MAKRDSTASHGKAKTSSTTSRVRTRPAWKPTDRFPSRLGSIAVLFASEADLTAVFGVPASEDVHVARHWRLESQRRITVVNDDSFDASSGIVPVSPVVVGATRWSVESHDERSLHSFLAWLDEALTARGMRGVVFGRRDG